MEDSRSRSSCMVTHSIVHHDFGTSIAIQFPSVLLHIILSSSYGWFDRDSTIVSRVSNGQDHSGSFPSISCWATHDDRSSDRRRNATGASVHPFERLVQLLFRCSIPLREAMDQSISSIGHDSYPSERRIYHSNPTICQQHKILSVID